MDAARAYESSKADLRGAMRELEERALELERVVGEEREHERRRKGEMGGGGVVGVVEGGGRDEMARLRRSSRIARKKAKRKL